MATLLHAPVLNPEGYRTVRSAGEPAAGAGNGRPLATLAPRLETLKGKTVYLVDTGFGGSGKFLDQVQARFKWRATPGADGCADGSCGLPDEP